MRFFRLILGFLIVAPSIPAPLVTVGGCASVPEGPARAGKGGRLSIAFAALEAGGCRAHPNGSGKVPEEITTLAARVEIGSAISETVRIGADGLSSGRWVIGPLPVTETADVLVWGCDAQGRVVYHGRSNGASIPEQSESIVRMFLVPVGRLACTGNKAVYPGAGQSNHLAAPRAFAAAATTESGDALIAGGLGAWDGSARAGIASGQTDIYDHAGGYFRKGPALLEKRAWHNAVPLGEHRVLVAGGVTSVAAQGSLPASLMAPTKIADALPQTAAEIIDVRPDAAGGPRPSIASSAAIGAGADFLASALRVGDSVLFAGGVELSSSGAASASDRATRVSGLAEVARGKAGTSTEIQLAAARVRPGLVAFDNGAVVVWGGNGGSKDGVAELGELIAADGKAGTLLKISGPKALLEDAQLATDAPALAPLGGSSGKLVFVVAGGMSPKSLYNGADVPSYLVVVDPAGTAQLKMFAPGSTPLRAGLGAAAVRLGTGQALIAGGLLALQGVPPCQSGEAECLLDTAALIEPPASTDGDSVKLEITTIQLGGPRAGIAAAVLPAGVLLAGGQATVVDPAADKNEALDPSGRVLAGAPSLEEQKAVCGQ